MRRPHPLPWLLTACGGALALALALVLRNPPGASDLALAATPAATQAATPAASATAATQASARSSPASRAYPQLPDEPAALAALFSQVEEALRSPATAPAELPALGHQEQVIIRRLARRPELAKAVRQELPQRWWSVLDLHLAARREFVAMQAGRPGSATVPAWRIIPPEPAEALLGYYRKAQAATGIPWEVLAAINLVESGMGRIDGVSIADARGPMQFLPSTWAERGIGHGDIRDPHDAIQAAARYLVRRGGLKDIRKGLWGYNNSDHYVRGVLAYAALLRQDPAAFNGLYHWEIHFMSKAGDLWLPVGYQQRQRLPVQSYLKQSPGSAPPQGPLGG